MGDTSRNCLNCKERRNYFVNDSREFNCITQHYKTKKKKKKKRLDMINYTKTWRMALYISSSKHASEGILKQEATFGIS